MDPRYSAQDVLRCHSCDIPVPPLCCDFCQIYLCKACVGEHILDASTEHKVVPIQQALSDPVYPKCSKHSPEPCRFHCKQCIIPICVQCASSKGHQGHEFLDLLKYVESKKNDLQRDVQEMELSVLIKYKEIASGMKIQRDYLRESADSLKKAIDERADKLHNQVGAIVKKLKSEVDEKEAREFSILREEEEKIARKISSIEEYILHQKDLQATRDLGRVYAYRSRNQEFRNVPPKHNVTMPTLSENGISTDELLAQFGSLRITRSFDQGLNTQDAQFWTTDNQLTDKNRKGANFQQTAGEAYIWELQNQFKQTRRVDLLQKIMRLKTQPCHSNPGYQHSLQQHLRMGQQPIYQYPQYHQQSHSRSAPRAGTEYDKYQQATLDQTPGRSQDNVKPPQYLCYICRETFQDYDRLIEHIVVCSNLVE